MKRPFGISTALFLALAAGPAPARPADPPAAPLPADEVVAVIRTSTGAPPTVVTLSRLGEEARIALVSRGALGAAAAALDRPALRAALDWLVDQTLLSDEAARLDVFRVEPAEAAAEVRRFQERFPSLAEYRAFLARNDLAEEELAAVLRRTLRVERYVQGRLSRAARVTDAEVEAAWRERPELARRPLDQQRAAIRARLAEDRTRAELRALLGELRARAEVRLLDPLGGPDA
ncbi:SurA N-terminal domain-containing protein [Anaeromyxobacter paludicola]|uniref:Uncharacterized protein n=1 Tax=Anaeromyxobacter paludicola TaxID=2918171 RepID=A0ABM7X884_9BACT|nr:hypothetical protein [Anaeromyxobacter paludicola]BDG08059.1 hypothetical protein AMPC_11720 [Anaeromyxobacter paludicola]